MKGDGFSLRRKVLEVVRAAGAEMPEDAPEMRMLRRALFNDFVVLAVGANYLAGMDLQAIEIPEVLHPARRESVGGING